MELNPAVEKPKLGNALTTPNRLVVLVFVGIAVALFVVAGFSVDRLGPYTKHGPITHAFPDQPWLDAWIRYDSG